MSFGLGISFGRLIKKIEVVPEFQIFRDDEKDYFNVIYKDGHQDNGYDDGENLVWKQGSDFYMVNKKALRG
jgi:hypothetical protein